MSEVDAQEFGEFKSSVIHIGVTLDKHLIECTSEKKEVRKAIASLERRFIIGVCLIVVIVLGGEKAVDWIGRLI